MARGPVPVTTSSRLASTVLPTATTGDATNNHSVANNGNVILIVKNTGASARILTVHVFATEDGLSVTSRTYSIPAGEEHIVGVYPQATYGSSLLVDVAHAELTLRAIAF